MDMVTPPRWLEWAQEIQALAQTGNHYAENEYQHGRYQRLLEIAAEIAHESTGLEYPLILSAYRNQLGYATPKVDVRGAVFREDKLLLVRERQDNGWTLPGGWADVGDLPSVAAEREVWEEAGFRFPSPASAPAHAISRMLSVPWPSLTSRRYSIRRV
jgi:hypothetical protein